MQRNLCGKRTAHCNFVGPDLGVLFVCVAGSRISIYMKPRAGGLTDFTYVERNLFFKSWNFELGAESRENPVPMIFLQELLVEKSCLKSLYSICEPLGKLFNLSDMNIEYTLYTGKFFWTDFSSNWEVCNLGIRNNLKLWKVTFDKLHKTNAIFLPTLPSSVHSCLNKE